MKLLFENWRKYLNEESPRQVTYGQLADALQLAIVAKQENASKERLKQLGLKFGSTATNLALSFMGPLGGLIGAMKDGAEGVGDLVKVYMDAPDAKTRDNTVLGQLNLDDSFEDLVDDRLENKFEAWVIEMVRELADDPTKRDQPVADMDLVLQRWLKRPQLSGLPDANRTVIKPDISEPGPDISEADKWG
jgi:hypothetical protein